MNLKARNHLKTAIIAMLSVICVMCLLVGCNCSTVQPGESDSIFAEQKSSYVLNDDYTLSSADQKATSSGKNTVSLGYAFTMDLNGNTLDLGGYTLSVKTDENALVVFKNGSIAGGKLDISIPNGDVEFTDVTIQEDVTYDLEAASETIRINNSTLGGLCTVKSSTSVQINRSAVTDITMAGSGKLNIGTGTEVAKVAVAPEAVGAKVEVSSDAKVTGEMTIAAPADVAIHGEVSSVDVKEGIESADAQLSVTVSESANVLKIDVNSKASVEVSGTVSKVTVSDSQAEVSVAEKAVVTKVEMNAAAVVEVNGSVSDIVVKSAAEGAQVEVKESASVSNIVVTANNTKVNVAETAAVESVKVVDSVSGTQVSDNVTTETVTEEQIEDILSHTHIYKVLEEVAPSCTEEGSKTFVCIECDEQYTEVIKPLGHDYVYSIVKAPTETETGLGRYTCTRCGDSYDVVLDKVEQTEQINGLKELLQALLGSGLSLDLSQSSTIIKTTETTTDREGNVETIYEYQIAYVKQFAANFDVSEETVAGSIDVLIVYTEVESLEGVNLSTLEYDREMEAHLYIENDMVYAVTNETENQNYVVISLEKALDMLANSNNVYQPVQLIASLIQALEQGDINIAEIQQAGQKLAAILDKLSGSANGAGSAANADKLVAWVMENLFTVAAEEETTTYTLDWEKVKALVSKYSVMTVSQFIDETVGMGASQSVKQTINLVPTLTVNDVLAYLGEKLSVYGVTMQDVYQVAEVVLSYMGAEVNIQDMLTMVGDMKLAGIIAMMNGTSEEEAQAMVVSMVEQVVAAMDQLTLDDALTAVYNMLAASNNPGTSVEPDENVPVDEVITYTEVTDDTTSEPMSVMDMLLGMIDSIKDSVSLCVVETPTAKNLVAEVMGQKVTLLLDMAEGITFEGVYQIAEEIMAQVKYSKNQGKTEISGSYQNYTVDVVSDTEAKTFTAVLAMNVTGEDGTTDAYDMFKVSLANNNGVLEANLYVVNICTAQLTAQSDSGEATLNIGPEGQAMLVNVSWLTQNSVTQLLVVLNSQQAFKLTVDASKVNAVAAAVELGYVDENQQVFTSQSTVLEFEAKAQSVAEDGSLNVNVCLALDASLLNWVLSGYSSVSPNGGSYEYTASLYQVKYNFNACVNEKVVSNDQVKDEIKTELSRLEKLALSGYKYQSLWKSEYVEITYVEEGADRYYIFTLTERVFDSYTDDIYNGTVVENVYTTILPSVDGLPGFLQFSATKECNEWYYINASEFAEFDITTNIYEGMYSYKNGQWTVINEELTQSDASNAYERLYFNCYYNTETKQIAKENPHDYKVVSYEYTSDVQDCSSGLKVTLRCTHCGGEKTATSSGCYYQEEVTAFETTCGTTEVSVFTCVACGDSYLSESDMHENTYTGGQSLDKEDVTALGYNAEGFYQGECIKYMCELCNLYKYEYTWYTYSVQTGCVRHELWVYQQINHTDETTTELAKVYATDSDAHYYDGFGKYWYKPVDGEEYDGVSDSVAQSWLNTVNSYAATNLSLSSASSIDMYTKECLGCGKKESDEIIVYTNSGDYYRLHLYYEDGVVSHYYLDYEYNVTDASSLLDDIQYDFSSLGNVSARVNVYVSYHSEYSDVQIYIYCDNGDRVTISRSYRYANVNWYIRSQCVVLDLNFEMQNDVYVLESQSQSVRHDMNYSCQGENCLEDGCTEVCTVCGLTNGTVYEHRNYFSYFGSEYICSDIYVEYRYRSCCKSYAYANVTLQGNVTLDQDVYIAAEQITFNLNGYTLDLNGYDFVLYSYLNGQINVIDSGRYEEDVYTLGKVVDSKQSSDGVFVVCANSGLVDVGNVNTQSVVTYFSDTDTRKTLASSCKTATGKTITVAS